MPKRITKTIDELKIKAAAKKKPWLLAIQDKEGRRFGVVDLVWLAELCEKAGVTKKGDRNVDGYATESTNSTCGEFQRPVQSLGTNTEELPILRSADIRSAYQKQRGELSHPNSDQ